MRTTAIVVAPLLLWASACEKPTARKDTELFPIVTSLGGFVFDARNGAALAGAEVTLSEAGNPVVTIATDAAGGYLVSDGLRAGMDYTVEATFPGYAGDQITVRTAEGRVVYADISLAPAQPGLDVSPLTLDYGLEESSLSLILTAAPGSDATLSWQVAAPQPWITAVEPAQGELAASEQQVVTLSVDREGLGEDYGRHSALIAVVSNGGTRFVELRIQNTDPNAPQLSYAFSVLDFGLEEREAEVVLRNTGTGVLSWQAPTDIPWLSFTPARGELDAGALINVIITADRSGLAAGSAEDAYIRFASNTTVDLAVPLRAHIEAPQTSAWDVGPTTLDFGRSTGTLAVGVRNTGSAPVDWTLELNDPPEWLSVFPDSGTLLGGASLDVGVIVNRGLLPEGPFSAGFTVRSPLGTVEVSLSGERVFAVVLEASREVQLHYSGTTPPAGRIYVNNLGEGTMRWTVTPADDWLQVTPGSGALDSSGGVSCALVPEDELCGSTVSLSVDLDAFPEGGNFETELLVSESGGQSVRVPVRFELLGLRWRRWEVETPPRVAQRTNPQVVYDPIEDRIIVWGGDLFLRLSETMVIQGPQDDTWQLDENGWAEIPTATRPNFIGGSTSQMAYDRARGAVVLTAFDTTWELRGGDWQEIPDIGSPAYIGVRHPGDTRFRDPATGAMAWDASRGALITWAWPLEAANPGDLRFLFEYRDQRWQRLSQATPGNFIGRVFPGERGILIQGFDLGFALNPDLTFDLRTALSGLRFLASQTRRDPRTGAVITVGGWDPDFEAFGTPSDTFQYASPRDGITRELPMPAEMKRRSFVGTTIDTRRQRLIAIGGDCCTDADCSLGDEEQCQDTWILELHTPAGAPAETTPALELSDAQVDFGGSDSPQQLTVSNDGDGRLHFVLDAPAGFTATPAFGQLEAGEDQVVSLTLDRGALPAGSIDASMRIRSNGGTQSVQLSADAL